MSSLSLVKIPYTEYEIFLHETKFVEDIKDVTLKKTRREPERYCQRLNKGDDSWFLCITNY